MHFCAGLPIILVGCKKDLRRDSRVIEELRKTSQRPVTPEEVRVITLFQPWLTILARAWPLPRRLVLSTIWSALLRRARVFAKSSSMPLVLLFLAEVARPRRVVLSSKGASPNNCSCPHLLAPCTLVLKVPQVHVNSVMKPCADDFLSCSYIHLCCLLRLFFINIIPFDKMLIIHPCSTLTLM